jgi:biotin carboxyl carrier protein
VRDVASAEEAFAVSDVTSIRERVVIAPCSGRFFPLPPEVFTSEGEWVHAGQVLGEIRIRDERVPVTCAFDGWVMGMLAMEGGPVKAGDPLFWIRP